MIIYNYLLFRLIVHDEQYFYDTFLFNHDLFRLNSIKYRLNINNDRVL